MKKKFGQKEFIVSIIGRDLRKTPEPEETHRDDTPKTTSVKEDSGKDNLLKKNRTHYRIEYTEEGPKFWTLH